MGQGRELSATKLKEHSVLTIIGLFPKLPKAALLIYKGKACLQIVPKSQFGFLLLAINIF